VGAAKWSSTAIPALSSDRQSRSPFAALYGNLVIFGTLYAQLVALDQATGKLVWKEKIDDYQAGYSCQDRTPGLGETDRRRSHGLQVRRKRRQDRERHQRHDERDLAR
jgi:hypothetical protein